MNRITVAIVIAVALAAAFVLFVLEGARPTTQQQVQTVPTPKDVVTEEERQIQALDTESPESDFKDLEQDLSEL